MKITNFCIDLDKGKKYGCNYCLMPEKQGFLLLLMRQDNKCMEIHFDADDMEMMREFLHQDKPAR